MAARVPPAFLLLPALVGAAPASDMNARLATAPKLGLGMAALGRPGYINLGRDRDMPAERSRDIMRRQAHAVLDEAERLGLQYIDCARSYGLSEDFVSSWLALKPSRSEVFTVGSKWGYEYTAGWRIEVGDGEAHEVKTHSAAQLEKQLGETRSLLPRLHLYQIHSATEQSGVLENEAVLDALAALRDGEHALVCGLSVSHPQLPAIERATSLRRDNRLLFGAVQATFNLLDQSAAATLSAAHEAGMFVIIKEAVANGRLTNSAPPSARLQVLQDEASALDTTPDALALAWVMSHPWVGMCLSGAGTVEQLRANAEALRLVPLQPEVHARLATALRQDREEYWAERRALQWN